jgi:predicted kinase
VFFWAVVSESLQEAVELFTRREEAEAIVQAWDRDEPEQAGALRVEMIEFETSLN